MIKDDISRHSPSKIEGLFPMSLSMSSPSSQPSGLKQAMLGISIVFRIEAEYNAIIGGMSPVLAGGGEAFRPEVSIFHSFNCPQPIDLRVYLNLIDFY